MFSQTQLEKYAEVLIWGLQTARPKPFKPYDIIRLRFNLSGIPLAEIVHRKLVQRKMHVVLRPMTTPRIEEEFYRFSDSKQRSFIGSWDRDLIEHMNGNMFISAPESLTHLKEIDPKRINETAVAQKSLRKIMEKREEKGLLSWTLCTYPTGELARQAGIRLEVYAEQIVKACFLDEKDPVAKWESIYRDSARIKRWLGSLPVKELHVESANCDLVITPGKERRYLGISGHNIPSFEIFTSPDWRGTRGRYHADQPSFRSGNYVEGVRLEFRSGKVVKSSAKKGEDFLKKMLAMDEGACRVGEFSLTDKRFSKIDRFMADTLFDENFGGRFGNCHIAVGASYSDTFAGKIPTLTEAKKRALGFNDSALHWDLVNTEDKRVTALLVDGKRKTIYDKGMFNY